MPTLIYGFNILLLHLFLVIILILKAAIQLLDHLFLFLTLMLNLKAYYCKINGLTVFLVHVYNE